MNGLSNMPLSPARGYPATVLGVIPYAGVSFFTYDTLKHKYLGKWYLRKDTNVFQGKRIHGLMKGDFLSQI